jgi:tetratricopeptide (TPR) repeat protein
VSLLWLLTATAPAWAGLTARVGPIARVEHLDSPYVGYAELMVHDANGDYTELLQLGVAPIKGINVLPTGDGAWFVRVRLLSDAARLETTIEDGILNIEVIPTDPALQRVMPNIDLTAAIYGTAPAPPVSPRLPLETLQGPQLAAGLSKSAALHLILPPPRPLVWATVDKARSDYAGERNRDQRRVHAQWLGEQLLLAGHFREARHYLAQSPETGVVLLEQAWATLGSGRPEEARRLFRDAHTGGADPVTVLEGLAATCISAPDPSCAAAATALAGATGRDGALLLAADVLQRGGHFEASQAAVIRLNPSRLGELGPTGALRRGDVLAHTGQYGLAFRAYEEADPVWAESRRLWLGLLEQTPSLWLPTVAHLHSLQQIHPLIENTFLLAQVERTLGNDNDAMSALAALLHRRREADPAVPKLMWSLFENAVRRLDQNHEDFKIASLHREVWSPKLRPAVTDHSALRLVATAYERLGLPAEAIRVLRDAFLVLQDQGRSDREATIQLARLYLETDKPAETRLTLAWLIGLGLSNDGMGEVQLLMADAWLAEDQPDAAREALALAAGDRLTRRAADSRLAMMDAREGSCPEADARFAALAAPTAVDPEGLTSAAADAPMEADAQYWWAWCLHQLGRPAEAQPLAAAALPRLEDETTRNHARYMAGASPADGTDVWSALAAARTTADTLDQLLTARKREFSEKE